MDCQYLFTKRGLSGLFFNSENLQFFIKKGINFENGRVYFEDGSFQELGKDQKALFEDGRIKPSDITKGLIN